ncbi:MAG: 4-hydroxy-tetrahydrodipicolinate reductase [Deltaproteobacteria bacterium]|nr:4-hydroxy-tetrahydrodipicolinate reductase [Deltaproteobacteria bacterium]
MLKIIIQGIQGRMGQAIATCLAGDNQLQLVAGVEKQAASPNIVNDLKTVIEKADVIIDFSSPAATLTAARLAAQHQKPMVIGTTGFSKSEIAKLHQTLAGIPVVLSPNMSMGVNVLFKLVELASHALKENFDIEIVEAHHRLKKDAPSGTALQLAEVIAQQLGKPLEQIATYARHGIIGERTPGTLGIQSLRGGDIVGTHTVLYAGTGEALELTHRATHRHTFAQGALVAAKWVVKQKPGIYNMQDVLGI